MAIDLTVQPWIAKMLMPADGKVLGAAINDFAQGFAGGYLARKANQRAEMVAAGETPEAPTGLERLVRLANPEQQLTVDQTLGRDISTIGEEIGNLKNSQDIFHWVTKNAAMAASPIGQKMLQTIGGVGQTMAKVEMESAGHIAAVELAKDRAKLMVKYGLGPDATPEQWGNARAQQNEELFTEHAAHTLGKDISGLVSHDDFDSNGNWLPGAQQRILKTAPRSQLLQSREEIANLREEFRTLMGRDYAPGPLEKDIKFIDDREAAGLLSHDKAERARDVRQGLEAKSSAAGDWMQRTEVQGLVKQKSKLMDAKIVAENDLEDELAKGKKTFGGTSASKAANLKRKVDQWNKKIENVNKEIDTFKPDGSGSRTKIPVLDPNQTGSLMDTNITRLAPQSTQPPVRRYNPETGRLE